MSTHLSEEEVLALTAKGATMDNEQAFALFDSFFANADADADADVDSGEAMLEPAQETVGAMEAEVDGSCEEALGVNRFPSHDFLEDVENTAATARTTSCDDVSKEGLHEQPHLTLPPSASNVHDVPSTLPLLHNEKTTAEEEVTSESAAVHAQPSDSHLVSRPADTNVGITQAASTTYPHIEETVSRSEQAIQVRRDSLLAEEVAPCQPQSPITHTTATGIEQEASIDEPAPASTEPSQDSNQVLEAKDPEPPPAAQDETITAEETIATLVRSEAHPSPLEPVHPLKRSSMDLQAALQAARNAIEQAAASTPRMELMSNLGPPSSDKSSLYKEMRSEEDLRQVRGIRSDEVLARPLFPDPTEGGNETRKGRARELTGFEDIPFEAREAPPFDHVAAAQKKADAMVSRRLSGVVIPPHEGLDGSMASLSKDDGKQAENVEKGKETKNQSKRVPTRRLPEEPPRRSSRHSRVDSSFAVENVAVPQTSNAATKKRKGRHDNPAGGETEQGAAQPPKKRRTRLSEEVASESTTERDDNVQAFQKPKDRENDPAEDSGVEMGESLTLSPNDNALLAAKKKGSHPVGSRELSLLTKWTVTDKGGRTTGARSKKEARSAPNAGRATKARRSGKGV